MFETPWILVYLEHCSKTEKVRVLLVNVVHVSQVVSTILTQRQLAPTKYLLVRSTMSLNVSTPQLVITEGIRKWARVCCRSTAVPR